MKRLLIAILVVCGLGSCSDMLDLTPTNKIPPSQIFADKNLCEAYMQTLYTQVQFHAGSTNTNPYYDYNMGLFASIGLECRVFGTWQEPFGLGVLLFTASTGPSSADYWPYSQIRKANVFLDGVEGQEAVLGADFVKQRSAEVRFIRAWNYFQMVKRFGGVPIVTIVIPENAPDEIMYPARNTEKEVYDFVISEMDAIFNILPDRQTPANAGRPTKWAAKAIASRAALYAASIAHNGTPVTDGKGLVGIDAAYANTYYTRAYNAADSVIKHGGFALFNKYPADKEKNFHQLFVEDGNDETIFSIIFDAALKKGHSWDNLCTPAGFTAVWNSNFNPFLDLLEEFDFTDGRTGKIDRALYTTTNQWDGDDYFGKRDPRFRASFFYPGCAWQNNLAFFHSSTTYTNAQGQRVTSTNASFIIPGSTAIYPQGWPGAAQSRNTSQTGLGIKKRVNEAGSAGEGLSDADLIIVRLGEMYLNRGEAAFYLNNAAQALADINTIRDRAGMPLREGSVTEAQIRQERRCELTFEEHSYWDLKRWRVLESWNGKYTRGLKYTFDYDTKKYVITTANADGYVRQFLSHNYYLPLGKTRITENKGLVDNPGYN